MAQNEELTFIEAVRKRPAMYVGSTSIRGFNHLLKPLTKDIFETTNADYFTFELLGEVKGKIVFKNFQKPISDKPLFHLKQ